ncbi:serine dehydratase subunit alpha family protein [Anaerococcus sp. WCA-380-WT-2B]|uniref:UPF0597 protein FYJ26_08550 n=1 Tax=Anaerococcus porci TaxID=2652269 RepID=A0A6N7VG82_9FIRM|nr:L-serine ammonia-lyase, iron-sulfur-dependent, subunit alpha [Anaerococcus porci]MSS78445.1 serine dehydratase subunit alpha family protein [Anaerococcus porci]
MDYKELIKRELIPAFGCTEPIAIAFASAKASELLGKKPEKIIANLSSNMIKNAYSVTVPGTLGRKGIEISIVAGALLADSSKKLELLSTIDKSRLSECDDFIKEGRVELNLAKGKANLYIEIITINEDNSSKVVVEDSHTNIVRMEKNGEVIFDKTSKDNNEDSCSFSFNEIYNFARTCDYNDIKNILQKQIDYNLKIAQEGLDNDWGSNIGRLVLEMDNKAYFEKLVAFAAAGSDARMNGCELPVIINSGSGNQGITTSVPLILYAKDYKYKEDDLYRALIFSNLISLYIKDKIGKLSAYCGVVSASSAVFSSIAFIKGEDKKIIKDTIINSLAVNSGIICDGAKSSCAMKIASSLRNAALAYEQAKHYKSFKSGDGIVKDSLDKTIETVANIARYGMKKTDEVVLNEMLDNRDYIKDFE